MKTIVIVQARMGSTRLPGKVLKQLGNSNTLTYVLERCKKIEGVSEVIVATSDLNKDDVISKWCEKNGIACFRGSENNVLDRYIKAAMNYEPDYIIRVTADCPFVDYHMASEMVRKIEKNQVDIFDLKGELPRGLAPEIISFNALEYIQKNGKENRHKEHVTYYAYENKSEFKRSDFEVSEYKNRPSLRVTLDTLEDYEVLNKIALNFDDLLVPSEDVIKYLLENPEIARINAHIEQKKVK
ncbi:3-deoxy-manno-octulosonate cytidylyltransferase [Kurthia zopfii]|uniref:3-deoxy-manno-octulosonate cytidylyltransferase n=1 Tax=Kurthia zopfii TaxID=1650 RepID=A0A8B4Q8G7_9BACL|nr:glycosyltransferase family protein [Kurthia zopfii]PWI22638.1 acylneuraminate cytidylyltransferase [Kurthia zopfii]TDR39260.1 spore coat polysaccharide biosynthesis protein SpsF [Kurthia zopfii]GEK31510.1 3-deoxy-manno-octulosonate cytidylyltransferase [Kurthia zopfii]STX08805.1 3-deoxy-manno-octulosonate cytidylyltransferase [Kurthia zopfii]